MSYRHAPLIRTPKGVRVVAGPVCGRILGVGDTYTRPDANSRHAMVATCPECYEAAHRPAPSASQWKGYVPPALDRIPRTLVLGWYK